MDIGTVQEVDDGFELRFERHFDQPIETVWQAITEPAHLVEWIGTSEVDLRPGGRIKIDEAGGANIDGEVIEVEAPRLFSYKWDSPDWGDGGPIRFELAEDEDGGTLLVFTHLHPPASLDRHRPQTLAGWHYLLDQLGAALQGRVTNFDFTGWQRVHGRYAGTVAYV